MSSCWLNIAVAAPAEDGTHGGTAGTRRARGKYGPPGGSVGKGFNRDHGNDESSVLTPHVDVQGKRCWIAVLGC